MEHYYSSILTIKCLPSEVITDTVSTTELRKNKRILHVLITLLDFAYSRIKQNFITICY